LKPELRSLRELRGGQQHPKP